MASKLLYYVVCLIIIPCTRGQFLIPRLLSDGVNPLLRGASELTGNAVTNTINSFTSLPLAISRALGIHGGIPSLINSNNVVDLSDRIIGDFNIGLDNEDARLNITSLLLKYGKSVEEHTVLTADGYILTMFRIPGNGPVMFLMHGLLGSADDFILAGPEKGLAYVLADAGYDVWLGNARGNKHSRKHINREPSEAAFWDFSWHEIGTLDLPAMIDYVLDDTGQKKLKYIGHSQGTTSFFVMASERVEYNEKISLMVALSPVAFMSHVKAPVIRLMSISTPLLHVVTQALGLYEFLPDSVLTRALSQLMCGTGPLAETVCSNAAFLNLGFGFQQLNATNLPMIYGHFPSGAAVKQFVHYGQGIASGDFRKFDYGMIENMQRYGSKVPPSYDLGRISAPVSLFYSEADWLAQPEDVDMLYNRLENAVDIHKVPFHPFNHIDYITGKDVKKLVYNRLMKLIEYFS